MSLKTFSFKHKIEPIHIPSEKILEPTDKLTSLSATEARTPATVIEDNESIKSVYEKKQQKFKPKTFGVWASTMTCALGGLYYGWNEALTVGFCPFFISQTLMGMSFIVLICSLAEILSTVSFSGGSYGMTRVVLGFYPGFLMANLELFEYLTYTSASAHFVSDFLCGKFGWNVEYEPLIGLVFYLLAALILLDRNYWYWGTIYGLGMVSFIIMLIYCFGSIPNADFDRYASLQEKKDESNVDNWFAGNMILFMKIIPFTTWAYGGIESGALVTDAIGDPTRSVPRGLVLGVLTLFVMFTFTMFIALSLPPGMSTLNYDDDRSIVNDPLIMTNGWKLMGVPGEVGDWLVLPAQIGMAFSFMLPSAKLFQAMSDSFLIPQGIGGSHPDFVFVWTISMSFVLYLAGIYLPAYIDIDNLPITFSFLVYLGDLFAFYKLRTDFETLERHFRSPLGITGAVIAGTIFLFSWIGMIGFVNVQGILPFFFGFIVLLTLFYNFYCQHRQRFSPQEQEGLFLLHVIIFNQRKKKKTFKKYQKKRKFMVFPNFTAVNPASS